jgi:transposase
LEEFKQAVIAACCEPGASVAGIAMANGVNANQVRRWMRERGIEPPTRMYRCPCSKQRRRWHPSLRAVADLPLRTGIGGHPDRNPAGQHRDQGRLAGPGIRRLRRLVARLAAMIRVDALWLSTRPLDMRAGTETILAQVVRIFGEAQPHHAYLFANRRGNRLKVLVHDGYGVWLANRRLNQGRFQLRPGDGSVALTRGQFDALILGLPWERLADGGVIRVL